MITKPFPPPFGVTTLREQVAKMCPESVENLAPWSVVSEPTPTPKKHPRFLNEMSHAFKTPAQKKKKIHDQKLAEERRIMNRPCALYPDPIS